MNARFKFRVWDKENEIWLEDGDCFLSMNGELTVLGIDAYGETIFCDGKNYLIEQCTGLKDKNGKLIYEGDIISSKEYLHEIVWNKDDAAFHTVLKGMRPIVCGHIEQIWIDEFEYEVIGNIHENTDLLGEDK